ncbi:hypothetical protein CRT38_04952 [Anaplasma phagocytophilum str. CRT38]|uniref:Uncharacterized protein n=1 Tax=Anaplasma phagocytophilum str. CRT38 TaxID=1269275 RepID=S6GAW8_ANAPH|nr:hypothetical protein CRT38_04952 [Anaplasma phagocytophilum str. CRT38]KDB56824.1 hypothetical protein P030_06460 [Anaplasma phagocytophilum str. CRT35]
MYKNEELTFKKTYCQGPQQRLEGNLSIEDARVIEIRVIPSTLLNYVYEKEYAYNTTPNHAKNYPQL